MANGYAPHFGDGGSPDALANKGQYIEFYHLVSNTSVAFRAFLTQFEDQFSSEWNEETVFGRMDPISTFKRTTRKISLGWEVVADSAEQAQNNLLKLSKLIRMLYPSYNSGPAPTGDEAAPSATHISGAPLMKLRFMNLVGDLGSTASASAKEAGLLGYVDGFTHSPILEEGFIETAEHGQKIFPKAVQLSCTFTVLHMHELGWNETGNFRGGIGYPYNAADPDEVDTMMAASLGISVEEWQALEAENQNIEDEANAGAGEILGGDTGGGIGGGIGGTDV